MELVILIVVIAVVLVVAAGGLVASTRRRGPSRPPEPGRDYTPGVGDDAETPRDRPRRSTATVELPEPAAPPAGEASTGTIPAPAAPPTPPGAPAIPEPEVPPAPEREVPASPIGRLARLRSRLARSHNSLGRGLLMLLSGDHLDDEVWEDVEATLLAADVGVVPAGELVESLRTRVRVLGARTEDDVRGLLRDELLAQIGTSTDRRLTTSVEARPAVLLVVGVNGTGKTTTCGKIGRLLVAEGRTVVLGAADTFRAAAADQLETWGSRVGARTVRGPEGGDPASVAFDAVKVGIETGADTVVIDTAGRLHTKVGLMDELSKIKRVVLKQAPVDEVILVLDATTGQNALAQARVFTEAVEITGVALTKLDGTAKGGIVIAVQRELGVPVKLVGLGEGPDDLAPFEPEAFVDALLLD